MATPIGKASAGVACNSHTGAQRGLPGIDYIPQSKAGQAARCCLASLLEQDALSIGCSASQSLV